MGIIFAHRVSVSGQNDQVKHQQFSKVTNLVIIATLIPQALLTQLTLSSCPGLYCIVLSRCIRFRGQNRVAIISLALKKRLAETGHAGGSAMETPWIQDLYLTSISPRKWTFRLMIQGDC